MRPPANDVDPGPGSSASLANHWCCVQSGHRERYGIPRALHRVGRLDRLVTDVWAPPGSLADALARGRIGRRLRDRFSPDLPERLVMEFSGRTLGWEMLASARGLRADARTAARKDRWTQLARRNLARVVKPSTGFVFAYCYEARAVFEEARALGLAPVLGQIDPGPVEDHKVAEIVRRWPQYRTTFQPGPESYYASWREECRLAEHIVVNSEWSRRAMVQAAIPAEKIGVYPLVYDPPAAAAAWSKTYPAAFTAERPLRLLFLGQCILRKGIAELIEAAQALADRPVEFTLVGNTDIANLESHFGRGKIRYFPRVSRAECDEFYRQADAFLFPTHSDGFGLTQLEAQAWKLPILASRFCAEVVEDGRTGWVVSEVSTENLIAAIEELRKNPAQVARASAAIRPWPFGLAQLGASLAKIPRATTS